MRIAFVKSALTLPARAGSDLHTTEMAKALLARGHAVEYFAGKTAGCERLPFPVHELAVTPQDESAGASGLSRLQRRVCRLMGVSMAQLAAIRRTVDAGGFDACIAAGLEELYYLRGLQTTRVWYAADELIWAAVSEMRLANGLSQNYRLTVEAVVAFLSERLWRQTPEATWVVTDADRRRLELVTGRPATVVANGVDLDFFRPVEAETRPQRAAFWGRLDFGPNEQAMEWFLGQVWDRVRARKPEAELLVIGFQPSEKVRALADRPGVRLLPNLDDLRPAACSAPVAIYPFVSGAGIKNKLLEGAAMARALVVSPTAVNGLESGADAPWTLCRRPEEWVDAIARLFEQPAAALAAGEQARAWVSRHHTWARAAEIGESTILQAIERRRAAVQ